MKKIYFYLPLILFFIIGCEKEEIVDLQEESSEISTVTPEEALGVIDKISQGKGTNNGKLIILFNQIYFETVVNSNEKFTVIPVIFPKDGVISKILMLKINGKINYVLFSIIPDKPLQDQKDFDGKIIINNLNGKFISGFRVEKGYIISRLVKQIQPITKCEDGYWVGFDMDCLQFLDETIIIAPKQEPYIPIDYIYPDNSGGDANPYYYDFLMGPSGGSSAGDSGDTTTTEENNLPKIKNEIDNPCAFDIFESLVEISERDSFWDPNHLFEHGHEIGEDLNLSQAILNIFSNSNAYDYIVSNNNNVPGTGRTNPRPFLNEQTGRTEIYSEFNSNYLNTGSRLSIARTMIHESIHAFLVYEARRDYSDHVYQALSKYGRKNGFLSDDNLLHHNFMSQFVNAIAYQLSVWDKEVGTGLNLGWQYYKDMAWGGLANYRVNGVEIFYDEFENYIKSLDDPNTSQNEGLIEKNRILQTIVDEAQNNQNAKGDDCP